jgi:hypothetical protein
MDWTKGYQYNVTQYYRVPYHRHSVCVKPELETTSVLSRFHFSIDITLSHSQCVVSWHGIPTMMSRYVSIRSRPIYIYICSLTTVASCANVFATMVLSVPSLSLEHEFPSCILSIVDLILFHASSLTQRHVASAVQIAPLCDKVESLLAHLSSSFSEQSSGSRAVADAACRLLFRPIDTLSLSSSLSSLSIQTARNDIDTRKTTTPMAMILMSLPNLLTPLVRICLEVARIGGLPVLEVHMHGHCYLSLSRCFLFFCARA